MTIGFYPRFASGVVLAYDAAEDAVTATGSCAAYLGRGCWLTAKHCVPEGSGITVLRNGLSRAPIQASAVTHHPEVDLAVIHVDVGDEPMPLGHQFYLHPPDDIIDGGDFVGFGYPAEPQPIERMLKGHFQRYIHYDSTFDETYYAGEMSVPSPRGFSGSVLYYPARPQRAAAVATANVDSSVVEHGFEEVERDGRVYKETIKRVVSYGIALMLQPHRAWLDAVVPVNESDQEL
jgi:hypothetical protein